MQQSGPPCTLLSLPELSLAAVVKCLNQRDRRSLASSCRALAIAVSAASQSTRLTVSYETRWQGLCKVLTTKTITCKELAILGEVTGDVDSALDVLLNSDTNLVSGYSFPGIEKLYIDQMRSFNAFLPANLVRLLPDLKELSNEHTSQPDATLQPIPYCSTVHKLRILPRSSVLPSKYHTAEDIRRQLPNITSLDCSTSHELVMNMAGTVDCIDTMLRAWGGQLTKLKLSTCAELLHCTRLQSLTWNSPCKPFHQFPKLLPMSLTNLKLHCGISEQDLSSILQLPLLRVLAFRGIYGFGLQQDWSNHPCTWQQLSVRVMPMVALAKLPLHSLKGEGCLKVTMLELPNPLLPNSLADVITAVQNIRNTGLHVDSCCDMHHPHWAPQHVGPESDSALIELVHAASGAVKPFKLFSPPSYFLANYPLTATALIRWSSHSLHEVVLRLNADQLESKPLLWFWIASRCCSSLETVKLTEDNDDYDECITLAEFSKHIQLVAQHYVAVTGKQLTLVGDLLSDIGLPLQRATFTHLSELQELLPSSVSIRDVTWEGGPTLTLKLIPAGMHRM